MGSSKKSKAPKKDTPEITLGEIMQQTQPRDPAKQLVRAALIFLLTRKNENDSPGTNPAMLQAVAIFEREGLTHAARHNALEAIQNFANENGGTLFEENGDPEDDHSPMACRVLEQEPLRAAA